MLLKRNENGICLERHILMKREFGNLWLKYIYNLVTLDFSRGVQASPFLTSNILPVACIYYNFMMQATGRMLDVRVGALGPAVETAGYKMIDVLSAHGYRRIHSF